MLKSLELFGFKSFADRTTFEFATGITCIVGPNGSGKSNVVDSIKWILGDQSPKSLRGKDMTDVIFNGSSSRKPAGYAEATLSFDNNKRFLNVDTDEVLIGRRIYRTGEAEYLVNRAPVRLKDIKELFLGTGAGTSAYSIIEQGRVDALLQATNQNRRMVFEEAAGISKFNVRKTDALRKLERVGQNLLRLSDIVDEVRSQLLSLRSQATKATRFREYTEELKTLRVGLAADDYRWLSWQLGQVETEQSGITAQLNSVVEVHQQVETEQAQLDALLAESDDRLRAVERQAAENREATATQEATIHHQAARKQELETEVARLRQQQADLQARADAATGELAQAEGDLYSILDVFARRKTDLETQASELMALSESLRQHRERLDRERERHLNLIQQASLLRNRVGSFDAQFAAFAVTEQRAQARQEQLARELKLVTADVVRRQTGVAAALEATTVQKEFVHGLRLQRQELLLKQEELQRTLAQFREQRSAGHARRNLLEDLEQRQEGLGVGVKEILARAQELREPPWNTVLGSVADLLSVDIEQAAVLEVALGSRAQVVVLSEYGPLLQYLFEGRCQLSGRVGFLALGGVDTEGILTLDLETLARHPGLSLQRFAHDLVRTAMPWEQIDLHTTPGVTCRADRLVKSAAWPKLAERLLCDTWIVESLEVAFRLATQEGRGARFVTQQGELLEQDGSLYVGTVRSETALVSRKSELRSLKNDLLRLDRQIQTAEADLVAVGRELTTLDGQWQTAQVELERLAAELGDLKSGISGQEMQRDRLQRDLDETQGELQQLATQQATLEHDAAASKAELAAIETELATFREQLEAAELQLQQQDQQLRAGQQAYSQEQLDLAKQEERLSGLQNARAKLDQERFQRDLQHEEAERRLQLIQTKTEQIEQHLATSRELIAELLARRAELEQQVQERQAEKEQVRQRRSALSEQELLHRHRRREWQDRQHALELSKREIHQQLQHLAERLKDEYQLELATIAAEGATVCFAVQTADEAVLEVADPVEAAQGEVSQEVVLEEVTVEAEQARGAALRVDPTIRAEIEDQIDKLRRKLKMLGSVSTESLRDLDELESRYSRLNTQLQDLVEAKAGLEEIVRRINTESRRMFLETFHQIREQFQELFRKLFGGGEGDIVLEDPENVLDCGIDVVARPPGKELRSISLLSGGEKTMTAVALLMAIFKSRPSPFCILDEVDAALDEGNVERYMRVVQEFREWTQFIVITHSKRTMSTGDLLYGVTMEESGISKRMSVRFDDISEDGNFKAGATEAAA